ncbi:hypothetical protein ABLN87_21460 [Ruegeria sp. SCPT10]|uniref:hypothetical protein n=1 Tax=Ruegeria sp. SCP10 TaxID=3141377 RepID=UPI0033366D90
MDIATFENWPVKYARHQSLVSLIGSLPISSFDSYLNDDNTLEYINQELLRYVGELPIVESRVRSILFTIATLSEQKFRLFFHRLSVLASQDYILGIYEAEKLVPIANWCESKDVFQLLGKVRVQKFIDLDCYPDTVPERMEFLSKELLNCAHSIMPKPFLRRMFLFQGKDADYQPDIVEMTKEQLEGFWSLIVIGFEAKLI